MRAELEDNLETALRQLASEVNVNTVGSDPDPVAPADVPAALRDIISCRHPQRLARRPFVAPPR